MWRLLRGVALTDRTAAGPELRLASKPGRTPCRQNQGLRKRDRRRLVRNPMDHARVYPARFNCHMSSRGTRRFAARRPLDEAAACTDREEDGRCTAMPGPCRLRPGRPRRVNILALQPSVRRFRQRGFELEPLPVRFAQLPAQLCDGRVWTSSLDSRKKRQAETLHGGVCHFRAMAVRHRLQLSLKRSRLGEAPARPAFRPLDGQLIHAEPTGKYKAHR
jgi:hypothetical protein